MNRAAMRGAARVVLTFAFVLVAGDAAAHPGHGTPHLLHEADAVGTWWLVGLALAAAAGFAALAKGRS